MKSNKALSTNVSGTKQANKTVLHLKFDKIPIPQSPPCLNLAPLWRWTTPKMVCGKGHKCKQRCGIESVCPNWVVLVAIFRQHFVAKTHGIKDWPGKPIVVRTLVGYLNP